MIGIAKYLPSGGLFWRGATLVLSNGIGQALGFLSSIAIARLIGVQGFGLYATVMALVFVLGLLVEAGLETTLTREIAADPAKCPELLRGSLLIKLGIGGTLSLLLALPPVAASLAPDASVQNAIQLVGPLITLSAMNASFAAVFRAWGRMDYVLLINVMGLGVQLGGILAILGVTRELFALIAWMITVQCLELILGFYLYRREAGAKESTSKQDVSTALPEARGHLVKALLKRSWPFALAGVLGALTLRVDLFIIEALRGPTQAGIYSVGTRLSDLLALAPNSFFAALLPVMAAQQSTSSNQAQTVYPTSVRNMALAGSGLALFGLAFADVIVWICFGPAFATSAGPLRLLLVGLVPLLVNRTTIVHLYATNRERRANVGLAVNLGVRALFCLSLVPVWGALGAAIGAVFVECVVLIYFAFSGAMDGTRTGRVARNLARRVARRILASRFRNFTPGMQSDHKVKVAGRRLIVYRSVFDPKLHFTSDFLARYLQSPGVVRQGAAVLDVGTGTGIAAISAAQAGAGLVFAVDINPEAIRATRDNAMQHGLGDKIRALEGDLFAPVAGKKFDMIVTNPPYLRGVAENVALLAYMGGAQLEWFDRFASEAEAHLSPGGELLMVLGDIAETEPILHPFRARGWQISIAAQRELIAEGLIIYKLQRDG